MSGDNKHSAEVTSRLAKIEGQVSGIRRMYEGDRYCIDVLDQISAERAGLEAAALLILDDHFIGCIAEALESDDGASKTAEMVAAAPGQEHLMDKATVLECGVEGDTLVGGTPVVGATGGQRFAEPRSFGARVSNVLLATWGALTGVAPHVLHHVGPLAGAAFLAGAGGCCSPGSRSSSRSRSCFGSTTASGLGSLRRSRSP